MEKVIPLVAPKPLTIGGAKARICASFISAVCLYIIPRTEVYDIGLTKKRMMPSPCHSPERLYRKPAGRSSKGFSFTMNVAWSEPWPAMKLYPRSCSRVFTAGLLASILSIWLTTSFVRSWLVPGAMDTVQNITPVSSSGTSPVFVVAIVTTRTTIPTTTDKPAITRWLMTLATPFLYFSRIFSYW